MQKSIQKDSNEQIYLVNKSDGTPVPLKSILFEVDVQVLEYAPIQVVVNGAVFSPGRVVINDSSDSSPEMTDPLERHLTAALLAAEGEMSKQLYRLLAQHLSIEGFSRQPQSAPDLANRFLDQGNYLAYGLAGLVLWVLGIPHSFPLVHGKTRRGALVFDLADVIKDGCIMPVAFQCAAEETTESEFRKRALRQLKEEQALEVLFEVMQTRCEGLTR